MKAVIMAGGKGTRIRSVAADIPKPMIPVEGKPVLLYQIENLRASGINDIILVTGYLGGSIREYFGDGSRFGVNISYFNEDRPMGTAGALYYLKEELADDFILLMGDLIMSVDLGRFIKAHRETGAMATLFVHPNSHPYDSDIIVTDDAENIEDYYKDICSIEYANAGSLKKIRRPAAARVTGFIGKKEERKKDYHNLVNSGIYVISGRLLKDIPEPGESKVDLDRDVIRPAASRGGVYAYRSSEYVKDMGTPDRYEETALAVKSGLMLDKNLSNRQKCVFIDRDGTINKCEGFIKDKDQLKLLPGAAEAIKKLNASRYLCVLITNQPVIARGELSLEGLDELQKHLETCLGEGGAYLDGYYFCPHHSDSGFEGEVSELKFKCVCRKPEAGLLIKAADELNISLEDSYMIGDSTADILCGKRAGTRTIGVRTGRALSDGKYAAEPDAMCEDLNAAVDMILDGEI